MKVLEIGNGLTRRPDTTVAIDKSPYSSADIIRDVAKRGIPFEDNYFDKVNCFDIIEHIEMYDDLVFFINEVWRVLKPDGIWEFTTPLGLSGLSDHITHHRCFSAESFSYLSNNLDETYEYMRKSDGITARFALSFDNSTSLHGIFTAIK